MYKVLAMHAKIANLMNLMNTHYIIIDTVLYLKLFVLNNLKIVLADPSNDYCSGYIDFV